MVSSSDRDAIVFSLSSGKAHDAPAGRKLLQRHGYVPHNPYLVMDKAYEGKPTRLLAAELGYNTVVPPKSNRKEPWYYDKELYKKRNEIERLFRRIKRFRRIFTRYDKLDVMFIAFILLAQICDKLFYVNTT
jgi:transposase